LLDFVELAELKMRSGFQNRWALFLAKEDGNKQMLQITNRMSRFCAIYEKVESKS
jgi:hypothetical protein